MATQKKHALVTVAIGPAYERLARISHPFFQRYCDAYDLAFVSIDRPVIAGAPHFQKLACFDLLGVYERLVFVDTDVLIAPDAPNIFDIAPPTSFGAYLVSAHTPMHDPAIGRIQQELGPLGWERRYFNSGVMVASRQHRAVFDPRDPDLATWVAVCADLPEHATFSDQTYLNYKVIQSGDDIFDIGYAFNHSLGPGASAERFKSHFIHCKGHRKGSKETEMRRAAVVLSNTRLHRLFQAAPALVTLYDRF